MTLTTQERAFLMASIRDIPDFPKPGIVFKDITTLLANKDAFALLMRHLSERYSAYNLSHVAGIDARGFIFGAALAQMLGVGFVPIRKKGKLPYTTVSEKYSLEYGVDEVEIHIDAFSGVEAPKVLLIDDLIATGGTAYAAASLINKVGAECVEACFIMGLDFLGGQNRLGELVEVYTVIGVD
ncbi:adenine phosphoribosyltransferase [Sulfuricurvum sp. IAE1]|uniref:adenine phosphoribosyltransferase n=1 Tax=Sulfuricurvum sp. IAE1 TaxID=2546102 RepID=UPI001048EDCD|nr:adenine phosphoribosyltransferase [Sulfuricurvum sp. IAE1]MDD3769347.1 adenine phosphoribosyltransferase [Sulfuricurvum sp.]MDX9966277.1 adenine phosphoribosyltransferase [Sulfuricurvum sp.]TDA68986.1 adenine phosphoribosyltransferase [Sulfuricurvum sp. IAE1]